jgi:hypothetical protein
MQPYGDQNIDGCKIAAVSKRMLVNSLELPSFINVAFALTFVSLYMTRLTLHLFVLTYYIIHLTY